MGDRINGSSVIFELDYLIELLSGLLQLAPALEGPAQLETDRVHLRIDVFRALQLLDGLFEMRRSEVGTANHVMGCGRVGFQAQDFLGVSDSGRWIARQEVS